MPTGEEDTSRRANVRAPGDCPGRDPGPGPARRSGRAGRALAAWGGCSERPPQLAWPALVFHVHEMYKCDPERAH